MSANSSRLLAFDYLRGFFIVVIIIDHLWRWPSLYALITGEGKLWVTAAEGFVIISGLLVGYVRGYKNRDQPLRTVTKKIWARALVLYIWLVIATIVYTALIWKIPTLGATTWITIPQGDWQTLITSSLTLHYAHTWVHFLYIYALLLACTPLFIWLLRTSRAYMAVTLAFIGYAIGQATNNEWLQWMPIFFLPAVAGYYLPSIQAWWKGMRGQRQKIIAGSIGGLTILTMVISVICAFFIPSNPITEFFNGAFTKETSFNPSRIPVALLWFTGFVMLFEYAQGWIGKRLGWLLLPLGTRSLTAYITHGAVLFGIALLCTSQENIWYNTLIGTAAIGSTWWLVRQPLIQKFIPQ